MIKLFLILEIFIYLLCWVVVMRRDILRTKNSCGRSSFFSSRSKSQAAMEFITTYGWALLILGVVLAGLAYLGVFNPSNFVKSSCSFDNGIGCPAFSFKNTSSGYELDIQFQNNLGDKITIQNLTIEDANGDGSCKSNSLELLSGSNPVSLSSYGPQQEKDVKIIFDNCPFLDDYVGSKQRYNLKLYYKKGKASMPTVTGGSLITVIEES